MKQKFNDNELDFYINMGQFYRRFSDFEMMMLAMTSHLTKVSANKVAILQIDSPVSGKLKALKKAAEASSISKKKKDKIRSIANKFGTEVAPYRNKLAHSSYFVETEENKLIVGGLSDKLNIPKSKPPDIENQLEIKTATCTRLGAELLQLYIKLTGQKKKPV